MNNIFTFEIDDEEEFYNQEITSKLEGSLTQGKVEETKSMGHSLFTFDDFDQFQPQKQQWGQQTISESKAKPRHVFRNRPINVKEERKGDNQKQLSFNKNRKTEKEEDKTSSQSQRSVKTKKMATQMIPGLEVEDLGTKDMQYVSEKKALKVSDLRKFLSTPLGDYKVKALIKKEGGNFFNMGNKFNVYIEQNNRYLFTISREGISEYIFSLDKNTISEKKKSYLGKMVANMAGTQFLLFDNGFSPKETRSLESCRKQLASIKYTSSSGPRKFTTIVSTNCQGFYALEVDQNVLEQKWEKKERDYLSILYSKAPQLDPEDGNYKLDFKGIVKKASVKNFILGGVEWEDSLIFGKIDNNSFVMEIKQPLSVFQAAAISISSIHYKLHWR